MATIEHTLQFLSSAEVEDIVEHLSSKLSEKDISVLALNQHTYLITINMSDDPDECFYIGSILGYWEGGFRMGRIEPRKVRIYGDKYQKDDYPKVKNYPMNDWDARRYSNKKRRIK